MSAEAGEGSGVPSSRPFRETGGKAGTADTSARPYRELAEVDWSVPTAILFGNEVAGVSMEALAAADSCCYIGTTGFVQSLNVRIVAVVFINALMRVKIEYVWYLLLLEIRGQCWELHKSFEGAK